MCLLASVGVFVCGEAAVRFDTRRRRDADGDATLVAAVARALQTDATSGGGGGGNQSRIIIVSSIIVSGDGWHCVRAKPSGGRLEGTRAKVCLSSPVLPTVRRPLVGAASSSRAYTHTLERVKTGEAADPLERARKMGSRLLLRSRIPIRIVVAVVVPVSGDKARRRQRDERVIGDQPAEARKQ